MSISECLSMAIGSLKANKMRALLTMLGIIIGISAVIAISTIGDALERLFDETMESMGVSNINVMLSPKSEAEENEFFRVYKDPEESDYITNEMLALYEDRFEGQYNFVAISKSVGSGKIMHNRKEARIRIEGANPGIEKSSDVDLIKGRFISEADHKEGRDVAVISNKAAMKLFGTTDIIGEEIKVSFNSSSYPMQICGVYEYKEDIMTMSMNMSGGETTTLYTTIDTAVYMGNLKKGYTDLTIQSAIDVPSERLMDATIEFFENLYRSNKDFTVDAFTMQDMAESAMQMQSTMILGISVIAGISLLVGGIGVMNIMLVSVTERTREIGIRKALGAPGAAIMLQFIIESAVICMIGGIIGTILGITLGMVLCSFLEMTGYPSILSILTAVFFSLCIGVFFGYYPAKKAAKLDPIEALRYE